MIKCKRCSYSRGNRGNLYGHDYIFYGNLLRLSMSHYYYFPFFRLLYIIQIIKTWQVNTFRVYRLTWITSVISWREIFTQLTQLSKRVLIQLMCPTFFSFIAERMCYFPTQFQCDSGHCIDEQFVCDGTSQCQDSSDEVDCRKYRFMKDQRPCLTKLLINYKCQNSISIYSQPIDFNDFGSVYSALLHVVNNKFCETGPIIVWWIERKKLLEVDKPYIKQIKYAINVI